MNEKELVEELLSKDLSFDEFYEELQREEIGDWDNVNDAEIINQYCAEMMAKGVRVSHILRALEDNPSSTELYSIWLGNSMETPTPINNKEDLLIALGLKEEDEDESVDENNKLIDIKELIDYVLVKYQIKVDEEEIDNLMVNYGLTNNAKCMLVK